MKLARAVQSRIAEDPEKARLTEAYDHLNESIMMNEAAIDDTLCYVKAMKEVDEVGANELHASKIEGKDSELGTLEMQLDDQLQVVGTLSFSVSEPDRALQFEVLMKLSESLSKKQAAKNLLEGERENALTCFLECDNEIRKLVRNSL